jgi:NTP pyrophosphatase (non-canonical NTP hydrolase)
MALRKWSIIEEEIKKCSDIRDPRFLRILGELHERLRQQHQQDVQLADAYGKLAQNVEDLMNVMGVMTNVLDKTGIKKAFDELEGDPSEQGSTYHLFRGKKN